MLRLGTKVDVVVTDHAMPGMTGSELARQIRQHWPDLPIILATGYAELPNGEDPGPAASVQTLPAGRTGGADRQGGGREPTNVIPLDSGAPERFLTGRAIG